MPTRLQLIQAATLKARRSWSNYTREQERALYDMLDRAAVQLVEEINRFADKGKIPPSRQMQLLNNIAEEMRKLRPQIKGHIIRGMKASVDYGLQQGIYSATAALAGTKYKTAIGSSFIGKDGKIRRFTAAEEIYRDSSWAKINGRAMDALLRNQPGGITLSDRVWDITWSAEKSIRSQIGTAVLTGESPATLGRRIRGYLVNPQGTSRSRELLGNLGPGVYRSARANAERLTRTELGRAYSEGTVRYAEEKNWIDGYIWRVTSGEPCQICQKLDGTFYAKGEQPMLPAHPHCMCYLELHIDEKITDLT